MNISALIIPLIYRQIAHRFSAPIRHHQYQRGRSAILARRAVNAQQGIGTY